jgi:hypothetical protein
MGRHENRPFMKIVVTHLTRMKYPRICVAGWGIDVRRHIRPVVGKGDVLDVDKLKMFALGNILDLGWNQERGTPPEVEDHYFKLRNMKFVSKMSASVFWQQLESASQPSLKAIFGDEIRSQRRTWIVPEHKGKASLGEILVSSVDLRIEKYKSEQKLRMGFQLSSGEDTNSLSVAVTDVRFYRVEKNSWQPDMDKVEQVKDMLKKNPKVILGLGLSRAKAFNDEEATHWLQVNAIHVESHPLWQ